MTAERRARASEDLAQARRAFEDAAAEGGPLVAPVADLRLGDTLVRMGEPKLAIDAYRRAATAPDSRIKPEAAIRAGECLTKEDKHREAEDLYVEVATADPGAALGLGSMLAGTAGEQEAATSVYRAGHRVAASDSQKAELGLRLARSLPPTDGEFEPILRQSIEHGDEATRVEAEVTLAQALIERPDADGAEIERLLEDAAGSATVPARHIATVLLARRLSKRDRRAEAKHLYSQVLAVGEPGADSLAAQELGALLDADGEHQRAIDLYRSVAERHSLTALNLARALSDQDNGEIAIALCEIGQNPDGPDPLFAADVTLLLAELLATHNRVAEAEAAYRRVLDRGDLTVTPDAATELADLRQRSGHPKSETLEEIVAKFDSVTALTLAQILGPRLSEGDEPESAAAVYRAAARTDAWTAIQAADSLLAAGERQTAREALELGIAAGGLYGPDAQVRLGDLIVEDDRTKAIELYRQAEASGDPTVVPTAQQRLAALSESSSLPG